jgi:phage tail sheath protein FI
MPQYLAPGVYVEEVDAGPAPIAGVGTSTAGFVGMTRRGPLEGRPTLVTNWGQFVRAFGGYLDLGPTFWDASQLPYAVAGFFANGGQRVYIMRTLSRTGSSAASAATRDGVATRLTADTVLTGSAGSDVIRPATLRGFQPGVKLILRMTKDGIVTDSAGLEVKSYNSATGAVTLMTDVSATVVFEARNTVVLTDVETLDADGAITVSTPTAAHAGVITLTASSLGSWGREVVFEARPESVASNVLDSIVAFNTNNAIKVRLKSTAGFYVGAWVEIDKGDKRIYRQVSAIDGPVLTLGGNSLANANVWNPVGVAATRVSTCEFSLVATFDGVTERFGGLTLANVPGRYYLTRLGASSLLTTTGPPAATDPFSFPCGVDGLTIPLLTGGADGSAPPTAIDVLGTDGGPNKKTGLVAFEDIDEVAILAAPGLTSQAVQNGLIEQSERLQDRFAILDPAPVSGGPGSLQDIQDQAGLYDTEYAAIYYPRILVPDQFTGDPVAIAPSGHLAGIYARVDDSRGVHKAPANEVLRDVLDLELLVNKGEQEILNPRGINVLRNFRADRRGLRVYGGRTLSSYDKWRYINVRRLFNFVEESLDEGLQWVVFEPNDENLWARVIQSVSIFLTRVWRDGALMGATPAEAFFVHCDASTMSDDDILNGRLVLEIGLAPTRPAEFVVIRIGQWLGGSSVQEL